jgi:hypothetical protein
MNKVIAVFIMLTVGYFVWHLGRYYEYKTNRAESITTYNAGYRSGRMDALAQIVECDNSKDPAVLRDYSIMTETLLRFGELDSSPYPCEE